MKKTFNSPQASRRGDPWHPHHNGGFILVAVLIVCMMSAMVAAGLLYRMTAEKAAAAGGSAGEQASAAAMSGIYLAMAVLTPKEEPPEDGSASQQPVKVLPEQEIWSDNPPLFENRFIADDGANKWYFTIYAQNENDPTQVRFGLQDETGKININSAPEAQLAALPGMTKELLDALIDYKDPDSETRDQGAEQDYYDQLGTPYQINNGKPFLTVEELLMVKGFNGPVVYGEDTNFNGILDPNEDDGDESFPPDNNDGDLNIGFLGMTSAVTGTDPTLDYKGKKKINLNTITEEQLKEMAISEDLTNKIMAIKEDGWTGKNGEKLTQPADLVQFTYVIKGTPQPTQPPRQPMQNKPPRFPANYELKIEASDEDLKIIVERTYYQVQGTQLPTNGRVNVNTAPVAVLSALLEGDEGAAQQIADVRAELTEEERASFAWLHTQAGLSEEQFKKIAPYLTVRGYQYRVRCVGFGVPSGRYRILEAVIDVANGTPIIFYLRDITKAGLPFPLDTQTTGR